MTPNAAQAFIAIQLDRQLLRVVGVMVLGNVLLPMAVHSIPGAGRLLMPIFFFTMVAGWRYGVLAAVLTALLSPLASHLATGMPAASKLVPIIGNSILVGGLAHAAAHVAPRQVFGSLSMVVISHRLLMLIPTMQAKGLAAGSHILVESWPGVALHVLAGYAVLQLLRGRDGG